MRVDGQKPDIRRERRTSGQLTAKSVSIKGAKRRFGGCAQKTAELTQEICSVSHRRPRLSNGGLAAVQKSAEGIVGRDVGKASEALQKPKGGAMDRPSRERRSKARTRRSGQ